ncbi:hypothetical protein SH449x_004991 [Pirellulaceae bacterium SH449]
MKQPRVTDNSTPDIEDGSQSDLSKSLRGKEIGKKDRKRYRSLLFLTFWTLLVIGGLSAIYSLRRSDYIRGLEQQCRVARELGRWEELEELAVEWGIAEPLNPVPFEHAAVAAHQRGGIDRCYAYLAEMPQPGTLEAWLLKGEIELNALDAPLASIDSCERAVSIDPSNAEAHHRLLYFWSMSRQTNRLKREIERGIKNGAATLETYAYWFALDHLRYADAAQVNRSWAEKYPDEEHFHVAAILALALMPEFTELQRENDLRLLEERFPNNPEVLFTQIERGIERGDDIRVESLLDTKKSYLENDHRYWRSKGWLDTERDRFEEASKAFETAAKIAPLDWQTRTERLNLIRKRGTDLDQAEQLARYVQTGRTLYEQVKRAESIFSLPGSFYTDLASYFDVCGLPDSANVIRGRVEERGR